MEDHYFSEPDSTSHSFTFTTSGTNQNSYEIFYAIKQGKDDFLYFELMFGLKIGNELDFTSVTNNGDTNKILETVIQSAYKFTDIYDTFITFKGSNSARTRLYQQTINKNFEHLSKDWDIYGLLNGEWVPFKLGENYTHFGAERIKKSNNGNT